MVAPLSGNQVVMHGPLARVVDQIVDDLAVNAALEEGIALGIVGIQVADDEDVGDVVVNQAALGVLAFGVRGVGQTLSEDVVAEGDGMRSVLPPFIGIRANEAL